MRPTGLPAAVTIGCAVLAAGCSSPVTGTASPAGAGPFTEIVGEIDLAEVDDRLDLHDVAATPDGSFVALMTGNLGTANRQGGLLVELLPGDDGLTVGRVTEGASYAGDGAGGEVHVAADGTVVALGPVHAGEDEDGEELWDLALTVLEPGAERADAVLVGADPDLGRPDDATGVLSADGDTLYAAIRWEVEEDRWVVELAAIDVATGALLAHDDVPVETTGVAVPYELALLPDGDVAVLVQNTRDDDGDESGAQLLVLDPRLRPVGEPVDVVPDERYAIGSTMAVLADGTVLVAVRVGQEDGDERLVTLRDGEVQDSTAIPGTARDIAVDAAGRHAYVDHDRPENGAAVATVDLVTGEVLVDVVLCDELGTASDVALSADGSALAATAACPGSDLTDPLFLLG